MKRYVILLFISLLFISNDVNAETVKVKLKKCVDGDTARFIIGNEVKSTRFLAINTPEIKHGKKKAEPYGVEASDYTCKRLKNAKEITLEYDDNSDKTDKYGRVLAWVFVDDELLQKDLIKKGYAEVKYLYGDYKYTKDLEKLQKKAKKEKLNIWSDNKDKNNEKKEENDFLDELIDDLFKFIMKKIKSMI